MAQSQQFSCDACGRSYAWKPQLAGKRVKCKCGQAITVPAEMASADESDDLDLMGLAPSKEEMAAAQAASASPRASSSGPNVCHSCGAPLAPGAVLCVQCGYNWKTGQHATTGAGAAGSRATIAAVASGTSAATASSNQPAVMGKYPGYRARVRPEAEESNGPNKLYLGLGAVVLLAAIGLGGWAIYSGTGGSAPKGTGKGEDPKVLEMIEDEGDVEAKEWLSKKEQRMLSGMTRSQAEGFVDRLYKMGAVRVFAFGGGVICLSVGIELPDDPASRKQLFDWQARWHGEMSEKIAKDVGQKYLLIRLRL